MKHVNASRDLAAGLTPAHWTARAACRTLPDPEVMWPLAGQGSTVEAARAVCRGCPVIPACLRHGAAIDDWDSVRGGLTGDERHTHHQAGLRPHQYPPHRPRLKYCPRCGDTFAYDASRPFAHICQACALSHPDKQIRARAQHPETFVARVRTGVCVECGRDQHIHARGLCARCYHAAKKNARLQDYPSLATAGGIR